MNHEQNSCIFFLGMKIKFNIKIKKKMYKYLKAADKEAGSYASNIRPKNIRGGY